MGEYDTHIALYLHRKQIIHDLPFATLYVTLSVVMMVSLFFIALTNPHNILTWQAAVCALMAPTIFVMGAPSLYDLYQWLVRKPAMTFTGRGIIIDAGPFDRHYIAWEDIEAISCSLLRDYREHTANITGISETFVCTSIKCNDGRWRRFPSRIVHTFIEGMYDFGYELEPLEEQELARLRELVSRHVSNIQPSLICDW